MSDEKPRARKPGPTIESDRVDIVTAHAVNVKPADAPKVASLIAKSPRIQIDADSVTEIIAPAVPAAAGPKQLPAA